MSPVLPERAVAKRLYYDSPELVFQGKVTDIQLVAREQNAEGEKVPLWRVALDATAFYPESGGQPWDTGVLIARARSGAVLEVAVERVEEDKTGEVWHYVRKPLVEGAEVEGRVDGVRRADHMQQHSGQHLFSAVAWRALEARTVSFHLGVEASTIDLQLADGSQALSDEQVRVLETEANLTIYENRRVEPQWYSREQAEAMLARGELLKLPEREGPLRVVKMDGIELNACGGTHVAATGAIGGLLIRRIEKVRAGWRLEFVCGLRAVRAARGDYEALGAVARQLSVAGIDVAARVTALQEASKTALKEKRALLDELAEARGAELVGTGDRSAAIRRIFEGKPVEFAKRVVAVLVAAGRSAVVGVTQGNEGAVVLGLAANDARHAGELLKHVGTSFGARGGGSKDLAQGVCEAKSLDGLLAAMEAKLS